MIDSLKSAPVHVWDSISFVAFIIALAAISVAGMALGYHQVLWSWGLLFFLDSDECSCPDCVGEQHPENKESASDMLKRKYVDGEITEQELDRKLGNIATIDDNKATIDRELETSTNR